MGIEVVTIDAGVGQVALLASWAVPGVPVPRAAAADPRLGQGMLSAALRQALADPIRAGRLRLLLGGLAPGLEAEPRHALEEGLRHGRLLAVLLPATSDHRAMVRQGQPQESLLPLAPPAEDLAAARAALDAAGAPGDPLRDQAEQVLAAWHGRAALGAGAAALALRTACGAPLARAETFVVALWLREAAMRLGDPRGVAALRSAARLRDWPCLFAGLAQMTPEFAERVMTKPPPPPEEEEDATPAAAPPPPPSAPPEPPELPGVDEALMAEMLREAAKNGTPFCEVCEAARRRAA